LQPVNLPKRYPSYLYRRMYLKDHYKTLELAPSATLQDIKKAYRKMAQQYHPDKNKDPYAAANFAEIKEAYETLTNPVKKNQYLQERWYNRATGNNNTEQLITPVNILKQALEFERYTSTLDVYRMDDESLFEYMNELLSADAISRLLQFNEPDVNHQVMLTLLKPVRFLNYKKASVIGDKLNRLTAGKSKVLIDAALKRIKQKEKWEQRKWLIVLIITAAICLLIKFVGG
jgi:molecular chaperone DnaJ